jgi:hypothetical protein
MLCAAWCTWHLFTLHTIVSDRIFSLDTMYLLYVFQLNVKNDLDDKTLRFNYITNGYAVENGESIIREWRSQNLTLID